MNNKRKMKKKKKIRLAFTMQVRRSMPTYSSEATFSEIWYLKNVLLFF
jgi:hypothetical protein